MLNRLISSQLARNTATYMAGNFAEALVPLILLPILTRFLSPEGYGEVAMFLTAIGVFGVFVGLNTAGSANRRYFDENAGREDVARAVGACIAIMLLSTAVLLSALWLFPEPASRVFGLRIDWLFIAVLCCAAGFLTTLRMGQWLVRKSALKLIALQAGRSGLNLLLSLALVVWLLRGSEGRMLAHTVAFVVVGLVGLYLLNSDRLFSLRFARSDVQQALWFGLPLIPHAGGVFLLAMADRIVINNTLGIDQVGIYNVAAQIAAAMGFLFAAFNKAYVPWLFERLSAGVPSEKQKVVRMTYAYFAGALLLALIAAALAPLLVGVLAGADYSGAIVAVGWLALGQAFSGMYLMVTNYVFYSRKTGYLAVSTFVSGAVNVGLLFWLTGLMGIEGAAMAFALAMGLRFLLTWAWAQRAHPMPWLSPNWASAL